MRKPAFCICDNKDADQLRGNREADQRLCFRHTESKVQFLFYLNTKFQASSHFVWLQSLVCVGPGRKPRRPVFSQRGSFHKRDYNSSVPIVLTDISMHFDDRKMIEKL